eukprot:XP_766002.1 hypothetical protein [Theileria parva strain Muguga]
MTSNSNSCGAGSGEAGGGGGGASGTSLTQSTPFNFSNFGILAVFCIILALSSSTYHNWPAIERSLVNDRVFQNFCTENEIRESIPGMYVCEKQRDAIGNLSLNIFLFEFIAYSIGGPLVDVVGVYIVMVTGFAFGFSGFILLYFCHDSIFIVKLSFCCWGMFGGLIIITAIHFARMFSTAKSLADGMMIFFENFASVIPLVIYRLIKRFGIKYYEAYGGYIIWGIFPSFLLALSFMPIKIIPENYNSSKNKNFFEVDFKCFSQKLFDWKLWANLVVFSIPVTSAMFYRKTFSAYFLNNPTLQQVFPFILLFVFLPIPFISALDQFISVHLTSAFLYILYILAFVCFFYRTRAHGIISMVLFCIAHSAEHQIMHYISKSHTEFESTLMGISYSVVFVVGFISQFVFDCIYKLSPRAALYTIISLLLVATTFSIAFQQVNGSNNISQSQSSGLKLSSLRVVYVIFWFIPFIFLTLSFKSLYSKSGETKDESNYCICYKAHYPDQKFVTTTMVFYSFSFYYVCTVFTVISTIFKLCQSATFEYDRYRFIWLLIFLTCFFIVPHIIISFHFWFGHQKHEPIFKFVIVLFICKILLFIQSMMKHANTLIYLFSGFLVLYGYTFFLFIHMLTYYNFQITYVERFHKVSLIHCGGMFTLFLLLRFFYLKMSKYRFGYYTLWAFNTGYFAFFAIQLFYYFPYEMDISFGTPNLPVPQFSKFKITELTDVKSFCTSLFSVALAISNLAILISFKFCLSLIVVLFWCSFNDLVGLLQSCCCQQNETCQCRNNGKCCCCCNKCTCCVCRKCCCCKQPSSQSQCECCKSQGKCCFKTDSCTCCKDPCDCCSKGNSCNFCPQCEKCVCICLKGNKIKDKENGDIIFKFFDCHFKEVDHGFFAFYLGNNVGWLLFILYLALSRDKNVYLSFR